MKISFVSATVLLLCISVAAGIECFGYYGTTKPTFPLTTSTACSATQSAAGVTADTPNTVCTLTCAAGRPDLCSGVTTTAGSTTTYLYGCAQATGSQTAKSACAGGSCACVTAGANSNSGDCVDGAGMNAPNYMFLLLIAAVAKMNFF